MSGGRSTALLLIVLIAVMHAWFTGPLGNSWKALWGPVQPLGGSHNLGAMLPPGWG